MLFEDKIRTETCIQNETDREFTYLDNSARIEAQLIRAILNDWFLQFPNNGQGELRSRLTSTDDSNHIGAFWELFLHQWLTISRCENLVIHPTINNAKTHPDFLATLPNGERFYLEAKVATGFSRTEANSDKLVSEVLDAINEMQVDDFYLSVHTEGTPNKSISRKHVCRVISKWLKKLDYDKVVRMTEKSLNTLPKGKFNFEGLNLILQALPVSAESRGSRKDSIGTGNIRGSNDPENAIRNAIMEKAAKYGQLNMPYVIAINALGKMVQDTHFIDAMFGSEEKIRVDPLSEQIVAIERSDKAALIRNGHPNFTRVSAVILSRNLTPWNLGQSDLKIIHNPWATYPLDPITFSIPTWSGREFISESNTTLQELLGIWRGWPEVMQPSQ